MKRGRGSCFGFGLGARRRPLARRPGHALAWRVPRSVGRIRAVFCVERSHSQNARERVGFFLMQLSPDAPLDPLTPPNGADWPGACTFRPGTAHHQPPLTIRDRGRSISSRLASPAYGAHRASARWLSVSDAPPRRGLGPAPNISGRTLHFRRPNLLGDFLPQRARRRLSESIS